MTTQTWQKSSHCSEGDSCVHVATAPGTGTIRLTESADPRRVILSAAPAAFRTLIHTLKETPDHG
ncbi:DUF397 domain-containing protein [Streptomyces sp. NPDC059786]|uniref:DUF397 domain-containing protein n=1 Tax=Streptomyces sp. NPDC059786 TaxID=3346946 RepID=UPI003661CA0F